MSNLTENHLSGYATYQALDWERSEYLPIAWNFISEKEL
jgi:hypothetical protein